MFDKICVIDEMRNVSIFNNLSVPERDDKGKMERKDTERERGGRKSGEKGWIEREGGMREKGWREGGMDEKE